MQYLLLCYANEGEWEAMSPPRQQAIGVAIEQIVQDAMQRGQLRALGRLEPTATSSTVRERNGTLLTTDGPFAETREQLGGYYLVDCQDLDEALALAGRLAGCRPGGVIEVRPLRPSYR